ncbi:MAG TPA: preprotein translocase subunit SecE [Thermoanaerobaculia bacterium]|nr:preprotein translocase subunit SecE [Thermoanaerobaculia bacterium]
MELVETPKKWWLGMGDFYRETKSEMKKVSWPSRHEVVSTTTVVIVATIMFGVYLWVCDVTFYKIIDYIFRRFGMGA